MIPDDLLLLLLLLGAAAGGRPAAVAELSDFLKFFPPALLPRTDEPTVDAKSSYAAAVFFLLGAGSEWRVRFADASLASTSIEAWTGKALFFSNLVLRASASGSTFRLGEKAVSSYCP